MSAFASFSRTGLGTKCTWLGSVASGLPQRAQRSCQADRPLLAGGSGPAAPANSKHRASDISGLAGGPWEPAWGCRAPEPTGSCSPQGPALEADPAQQGWAGEGLTCCESGKSLPCFQTKCPSCFGGRVRRGAPSAGCPARRHSPAWRGGVGTRPPSRAWREAHGERMPLRF